MVWPGEACKCVAQGFFTVYRGLAGKGFLSESSVVRGSVVRVSGVAGPLSRTRRKYICSGQLIPDTTLSLSSAFTGESPPLCRCGRCLL